MNYRKYGRPPYRVAVVHGGAGAAGELAPVAQKLSEEYSVIEPMQAAMTVNGQVEELKEILMKHADLPAMLIGYSWGAWLSYLVAAKYPDTVRKLILISSGPFEEQYAGSIWETRMARLTENERHVAQSIVKSLNEGRSDPGLLDSLGELTAKSDTFEPIRDKPEDESSGLTELNQDIFESVWNEAAQLRKSGTLIEKGKLIDCSVAAIHGDYDPHPWQGVKEPLSRVIRNFEFILLEKCGHTPWKEKYAQERFYGILSSFLKNAG